MQRDSQYLPIILGVGILFCVILGMGGIAYSFYTDQIAQEKQEEKESSYITEDDSPFEKLNREDNIVIVPVPQEEGGTTGILPSNEGIPTGTYSNPPSTIQSTANAYLTDINRPIDNFDSSVARNRQNQERISSQFPDYSSPTSSNDFNSTRDNSLIKPLDNSDFLEIPTTDTEESSATSSFSESSF
ncbi:hypothetical protein I4641_08065 [Waterburya agarophytonicola K14]|uniref:Uncharacterized protein n=1 Tax=Waterburya agarophytonicola KI4 TaxID=2874699 RepID=A0A964BQX6_9CYAN|nr:hypothetical protein [Waterburya agarophytonicola]MCC0176933.1 hypothetical protein [Waterburya agarophytonicola KI4]